MTIFAWFSIAMGVTGTLPAGTGSVTSGMPSAYIFVNHDCPICNAYSPEFARIAREFGTKVRLQLVYSEPGFGAAQAKILANEYGLEGYGFRIDATRRFAASCGATVVPEAALFDRRGKKVWIGRIDNQYASFGVRSPVVTVHDFRDALRAFLNGKRPNPPTGKPIGCYILSPEKS